MPLVGPLITKSDFRARFSNRLFRFFLIILIIFVGASVALYFMSKAPEEFPVGVLIEIPEGTSVIKAGQMLEEQKIVKSAVVFQTLVIILSGDKGIRAGYYIFDSPQSVITIADKLSFGRYGISRKKVTLPEGSSSMEMAKILGEALPLLDKSEFIEIGMEYEGHLFPETYYFFETATASKIALTLRNEFNTKLEPYLEEIAKSGHTEKEILTMASIIEKESNGKEDDRRMISGILWNRISKGMALQVDATYLYTLEKRDRNNLTTSDIKNDTSPYNTYKNVGLPPGPIGNPGLKSILAALRPTKSNYIFYIHDRNGTPHYAVTYAQHQANIASYLR
ncbi:MAG: endolytic transglycosylase MltG [Candidatus Pacebacteria bacterium]|nr:endolytic transglycosylase MltG [Candidatus Paceibacterota bacterium]